MFEHHTKIPRICHVCHTQFWAWPHEIKDGVAKFCSRACWHVFLTVPLKDRFFKHVGKPTSGGCTLWLGKKDRNGYGRINADGQKGKTLFAHRIAWELANGPIPGKLFVLHNCPSGDNPSCVNPCHLWLGAAVDNLADMREKGRQVKGEKHGRSKLTDEIVKNIRQFYRAGGVAQRDLAEEHGVSIATICLILNNKIWKHIK